MYACFISAMRVTASDFIVVLDELRNSDRKAACVYVGGGGGGGGGGNRCICPPSDRQATSPLYGLLTQLLMSSLSQSFYRTFSEVYFLLY